MVGRGGAAAIRSFNETKNPFHHLHSLDKQIESSPYNDGTVWNLKIVYSQY